MKNPTVKPGRMLVEVISGAEGACLSFGDGTLGERVAGPKPWGGGRTIHRFKVCAADFVRLAREYGGAEVRTAEDYDTLHATSQRLQALSVENIMLDIVPGFDGMGEEVYAKSVADVESKLSAMGDSLEFLEGQSVQLTAENQRLEGEVARLHKLLGWMSSGVKEGWDEVCRIGAVATYLGHPDALEYLDGLPECSAGLAAPAGGGGDA